MRSGDLLAQSFGDALDRFKIEVLLAELDRTVVGAMHAYRVGECFLTDAEGSRRARIAYDLTLTDIRTDGIGQDGAKMCSASGHFEIKPDLSRSDLDDLACVAQGRGVQKSLTVPMRLHYEVLQADDGNVVVQTH